MNYYYNQNYDDYPYDDYMQNENENNLKTYKYENRINPNKKSPGYEYPLDTSSSQEVINSKEDIIQTQDENDIQNINTGKFKYTNSETDMDQDNKDQMSYRNQDSNSKKDDKSNKITNNICIIINKPELKDRKNDKDMNIDYLDTFGNEDSDNKKIKHVSFKSEKPQKEQIPNKKQYNSYYSDYKNKNAYPYDSQDENEDDIGSYLDKKMTLHKELLEKKKRLRDLEDEIMSKENFIKDKKLLINQIEKEHSRSLMLNENDNYQKKNQIIIIIIKLSTRSIIVMLIIIIVSNQVRKKKPLIMHLLILKLRYLMTFL
jgi:hypothetical protein